MTIQMEHGDFDRASTLVSEIGASLRREHQRVASDVDDLMAGRWTGRAADQFAQGWAEWCQGMDDILEAIRLQNSLTGEVRTHLDGSDHLSQAASAQLQARLGG